MHCHPHPNASVKWCHETKRWVFVPCEDKSCDVHFPDPNASHKSYMELVEVFEEQ
jgi:hypothetical protein